MTQEFPGRSVAEPTNVQLAAAGRIDWYTAANMCAVVASGYIDDFARAKRLTDVLSSFRDYGFGVYSVDVSDTGTKIIESQDSRLHDHSRLAEVLNEAKNVYSFPEAPFKDNLTVIDYLWGMMSRVKQSGEDELITKVRFSFLEDTATQLVAWPGKVLPNSFIPMGFVLTSKIRDRWEMRRQLAHYKHTIKSMPSDKSAIYFPKDEIPDALAVSGELWAKGLAQETDAIIKNMALFRPESGPMPDKTELTRIGRALGFSALEVQRIKSEEEQAKVLHEIRAHGAPPNHFVTTKRPRFL